jgi:hypothetical protein
MSRFILVVYLITIHTLYFVTFDIPVYCEDGSQCPPYNTCCLTSRGYSCCPYKKGICCGDDFHCCSPDNKCDLSQKLCINETGETKLLTEMAPTSLIYKKGWNELYYNCKDDLNLIKEDIYEIFNMFNNSSDYINIKNYFGKLVEDGKITREDCLKFLREVFG